ncbi:hypothetical protein [Methylococcus sp. EFPC2]|uniref:hypothetical protein n=1 Tax=Methylococcus sp. EFPC2 TaxID=2812648 RepID=UPI001966EF9E|nr:hypothetical protein [Methylococcus sp. EFPC2]QSA98614.1 hypothetical protein JWZ97_07425 [Methylococcus sp. EFPC2]
MNTPSKGVIRPQFPRPRELHSLERALKAFVQEARDVADTAYTLEVDHHGQLPQLDDIAANMSEALSLIERSHGLAFEAWRTACEAEAGHQRGN